MASQQTAIPPPVGGVEGAQVPVLPAAIRQRQQQQQGTEEEFYLPPLNDENVAPPPPPPPKVKNFLKKKNILSRAETHHRAPTTLRVRVRDSPGDTAGESAEGETPERPGPGPGKSKIKSCKPKIQQNKKRKVSESILAKAVEEESPYIEEMPSSEEEDDVSESGGSEPDASMPMLSPVVTEPVDFSITCGDAERDKKYQVGASKAKKTYFPVQIEPLIDIAQANFFGGTDNFVPYEVYLQANDWINGLEINPSHQIMIAKNHVRNNSSWSIGIPVDLFEPLITALNRLEPKARMLAKMMEKAKIKNADLKSHHLKQNAKYID